MTQSAKEKKTNFTVRSLATFYQCTFYLDPDRERFMNHCRAAGLTFRYRTQFQRLAALNLPQSFSSSMTASPLPPLFPTLPTLDRLHAPSVALSSLIKSANYRALTMCSGGSGSGSYLFCGFRTTRNITWECGSYPCIGEGIIPSGGRNLGNLAAAPYTGIG